MWIKRKEDALYESGDWHNQKVSSQPSVIMIPMEI